MPLLGEGIRTSAREDRGSETGSARCLADRLVSARGVPVPGVRGTGVAEEPLRGDPRFGVVRFAALGARLGLPHRLDCLDGVR